MKTAASTCASSSATARGGLAHTWAQAVQRDLIVRGAEA
ncbi:hypothetical protein ABIC99_003926 [Sphaerotilus sulfidivorans]|uniref:Uncharacterized protein n=1 Tax=Sphaerotilus sulfidivorans TaxID=639200 RepID=A0ABV2ITG8_9BURK